MGMQRPSGIPVSNIMEVILSRDKISSRII